MKENIASFMRRKEKKKKEKKTNENIKFDLETHHNILAPHH
jgi:hypothetical protein